MNKSKISILIIMAVVAVLAITLVVLSVVKINYAPAMVNPYSISVKTINGEGSFTDGNENYDKILSAYNNSYSRSVMSAVFAGQTSNALNVTVNGTLPTVNKVPSADNTIRFKFTESAQKLVINGKVLPNTYTEVFFAVNDDANFVKTSVYFKQSGDVESYYQLDTYANQSELMKLISDFNFA